MARYMKLFILKILIYSGAIFVDAKRSICGDSHLVKKEGIIRSPNYPHPYPNSTDCTWTILSPPYTVLTLMIQDLDIEDDQNCVSPPCCRNNALILPADENGVAYNEICGHNISVKPIHLTQLESRITFHASSSNVQSRGFLLSYFIQPLHSGLCPPDQVKCGENSHRCYSSVSEHCDGIFQCPNGEDEMGCDIPEITSRNNKVDRKVSDQDKCKKDGSFCEGNECNENGDQEACLGIALVSATIMASLFCALLLVIVMMCGLRMYTMHNNNAGNYRIPFPAHIASRLSLTRYISLPELMDNDFFHREPPPSYSIAISQPNSEVLPPYTARRVRPWREQSVTPMKPPTPPPSSETSNQSSPSRDSITSSSYLSNDDNVQLVNPGN